MKCYCNKNYDIIRCKKCNKEFSPQIREAMKSFSCFLNINIKPSSLSQPLENEEEITIQNNETKIHKKPSIRQNRIKDSFKGNDEEKHLNDIKRINNISTIIQPENLKCITWHKTEIPNQFLFQDMGFMEQHSIHINFLPQNFKYKADC